MKIPFISRERYENEMFRQRKNLNDAHEHEIARLNKEWEKKWEPLLARMMTIRARRDDISGGFVVSVNLEREAMENCATFNDSSYWQYVAKMLSVYFERQLATMNFAGLHKLALETDRKVMDMGMRMPLR